MTGGSGDRLPLRWRILRDPPASGAWNMAVDDALARCRAPGEATLRIYRWARPTLSFGRNQPARGRYDDGAAPLLGAEVVRRPTGGREVLHDRELTYAVVLPLRALGGLREVYAEVNQGLMEAVRSLGVPAEAAAPGGRAPAPDAGACFAATAPGEVAVGGRKLVGSAQARMERSLLQHGSLLLGAPSVSLEAFRAPPEPEGGPGGGRSGEPVNRDQSPGPGPGGTGSGGMEGAVTLGEVLGGGGGRGSVSFPVVAGAVEAALAARFGGEWRRGELSGEEQAVARSLLRLYQSFPWTWRR